MKKQLEPTLKDFLSICSPSILKQWKLHLASAVNHNMSELGVKTSVSFQGAQVVGSTIALLSMNWWIEQALEEIEPPVPAKEDGFGQVATKEDEERFLELTRNGPLGNKAQINVANDIIGAAKEKEEQYKPPPPTRKKPKPPKVKQGQLSKEEHKARMAEVLEMNKANKKVTNG